MSARGTAHRREASGPGRLACRAVGPDRGAQRGPQGRPTGPGSGHGAVVDPAGRPGLRPDLLGGVDRRVVGVGGRWVATPDPCAGAGSGSAEHMGLVGAAGGVSRVLDAHREHPHPRPTDGDVAGVARPVGVARHPAHGRGRWPCWPGDPQVHGVADGAGRARSRRAGSVVGPSRPGADHPAARLPTGRSLGADVPGCRRPRGGAGPGPTTTNAQAADLPSTATLAGGRFAVRMALSTSGALSRDAAAGNGNGGYVDNGSR
jgi:hypothetical protein